MDVFGLTPIDTTLSVLGLNLSQALLDFLFAQSKIGYLSFALGLLLTLYKTINKGSYRPLIIHGAIWLGCFLFIIIPPSPEGNLKSAWEKYGQQSLSAQAVKSAQDLKSAQSAFHTVPVILSFVGQTLDAIAMASVAAMSQLMPDYAQFLKYPFGFQDLSWSLHKEIHEGVNDLALKERVQQFAYDHYVPAMSMLKNSSPSISDLSVVPVDPQGNNALKYSAQGEQVWNYLKRDIKTYINASGNPWVGARPLLTQFYAQQEARELDDALINALVQAEVCDTASKRDNRQEWLWQAGHLLLRAYPYAQGCVNLLLYAFFPLLICLGMSFARLDFIFYYAKVFVWVKSLSVTAFLAYITSMMIAHVSAQSNIGIQWFWQEPYALLGAGILVYILPVAMLFLICRETNIKEAIK